MAFKSPFQPKLIYDSVLWGLECVQHEMDVQGYLWLKIQQHGYVIS